MTRIFEFKKVFMKLFLIAYTLQLDKRILATKIIEIRIFNCLYITFW